jgi:ribosomal protein S14
MKLFSKKTDSLHRIHFKNKEYLSLLGKLLLKNSQVPRYFQRADLLIIGQARVNNHCILTGRTHAVYKGFKVSRFILKGMGALGYLPGIRKCS